VLALLLLPARRRRRGPRAAGAGAALLAACILLGATGCSDVSITQVARQLVVSPSLIDVGSVPVAEDVPVEIRLDSAAGGEIRILGVDVLNVSGDFVSLVSEPEFVVPHDGTAFLNLTYAPMQPGYHWAIVTIASDAEEPYHKVTIRGRAGPMAAGVAPAVLDFGPVAVGDVALRTLTVWNDAVLDFTVVDLGLDHEAFSLVSALPVDLAEGEAVDIEVTFQPIDDDAAVGVGTFDLGPWLQLPSIVMRGNDCEGGSPAEYDLDGDGFATCGGDCDDNDPTAHPGAIEEPNLIDDDCDGEVDEGTVLADDDGDGFSEDEGDCNDGDASVYPGAEEIPGNGIDDDCDGEVDQGTTDADADGYSAAGGDCDDSHSGVYPGAPELPDGLDNDCDGDIDEGTTASDDDGDGFSEDEGDCDDTDPDTWPGAPELEDWSDNDCDGEVDEGTDHADDDGDGYSEQGGDCDDGNPAISPAQLEIVGNGIDDDCDGVVD
jgi:hypothetical protein